jgi:hypothetical protein
VDVSEREEADEVDVGVEEKLKVDVAAEYVDGALDDSTEEEVALAVDEETAACALLLDSDVVEASLASLDVVVVETVTGATDTELSVGCMHGTVTVVLTVS